MNSKKTTVLLAFALVGGSAFGASYYGSPNSSYGYYNPSPAPINNTAVVVVGNRAQTQMQPVKPDWPKWYVGGNLFYNLALFEAKHMTNGVFSSSVPYAKDDFSASQFGGALYVGQKFNRNFRADVEAGWFLKYSEQSAGVEFSLDTPYALANVYYDMDLNPSWGGFYFGAGLGVALPTSKLHGPGIFLPGGETKTNVSVMGALAVGWQIPVADSTFFDIKYRLSAYKGGDHTRQWQDNVYYVIYDFTSSIGWVLNNTVSVGIRYEF